MIHTRGSQKISSNYHVQYYHHKASRRAHHSFYESLYHYAHFEARDGQHSFHHHLGCHELHFKVLYYESFLGHLREELLHLMHHLISPFYHFQNQFLHIYNLGIYFVPQTLEDHICPKHISSNMIRLILLHHKEIFKG